MALSISAGTRRMIEATDTGLFLGLIDVNGRVLVTLGSPAQPGHKEWLEVLTGMDAMRGFSFGKRNGELVAFMRASTVNDPPDFLLEPDYVSEVIAILGVPIAPSFRLYYH